MAEADENDVVLPFGAEDGSQWTLASLRDEHGNWKRFLPNVDFKDDLRADYLANHPGALRARFDSAWPLISLLTDYVYPPGYPPVAIVDSGIVAEHPQLAGCIKTCVDFTAEGIDDRVGHGTNVALLYRELLIGTPPPHLIILKIFAADGLGTRANLLKALSWIADYNAKRAPNERIAKTILSGGVYSRRMLLLACDGHCDVCEAARHAAPVDGMALFAAAGNRAGITACPARAAFTHDCNVVAAASSDEKLGIGTVALPSKYATVSYVSDDAPLQRANRAAFTGDPATALDAYTAVTNDRAASAGDVQVAAFNRCYSLGQLGRSDEAIACYADYRAQFAASKAIDDRRAIARAMNETAALLAKLGRTDEALTLDDDIVTQFGDDPDVELRHRSAFARRNAGALLAARGAIDAAVAKYDDVVQRYANDTTPELRLSVATAQLEEANLLRDHGQAARALPLYAQLSRRLDGTTVNAEVQTAVSALIHYGIALADLNRTADAAAIFDHVIATYEPITAAPFPALVASARANRTALNP